jgi:hypothetical protein
MNQDSSTTWHQTLPDDPMLVAGDDDFTNFLHLGIDFPGFDDAAAGHNGFDTPMGDLGMDQLAMGSSVEDMRDHTVHTGPSLSDRARGDLIHEYAKLSAGADSTFRIINAPAAQHHPQSQHYQKHDLHKSLYEPRIIIPPTPQSNELQGAAARYYQFIDSDGLPDFDPYQRHRNDQVSAKDSQKNVDADYNR